MRQKILDMSKENMNGKDQERCALNTNVSILTNNIQPLK